MQTELGYARIAKRRLDVFSAIDSVRCRTIQHCVTHACKPSHSFYVCLYNSQATVKDRWIYIRWLMTKNRDHRDAIPGCNRRLSARNCKFYVIVNSTSQCYHHNIIYVSPARHVGRDQGHLYKLARLACLATVTALTLNNSFVFPWMMHYHDIKHNKYLIMLIIHTTKILQTSVIRTTSFPGKRISMKAITY